MTRRRLSKPTAISLFLLSAIYFGLGCGNSDIQPPSQAVLHQRTEVPAPRTWTKADKIAAINKAAISPEQKKAEIDRVNAGSD